MVWLVRVDMNWYGIATLAPRPGMDVKLTETEHHSAGN